MLQIKNFGLRVLAFHHFSQVLCELREVEAIAKPFQLAEGL